MKSLCLVPTPQQIQVSADLWKIPFPLSCSPFPAAFARFQAFAHASMERVAQRCGFNWEWCETGNTAVSWEIDSSLALEAYRIRITEQGVVLAAGEGRGAQYAWQTLLQILVQADDAVPCLEIADQPALPQRGYMLDISRTRVPTMDTLYALIDLLASLKYNQLQLYTEHTFAFSGHATVWGEASPLIAEEIHCLDAYAADRGIELVPNFNSFGHFERWLKHPEYFHLAECPYGWRRPDGHGMAHGSTLAPTEESRAFIESLFAEYLPLFRSERCHIGGDEPWELGMGRSRERCAVEGKHAVYLDFLNQIARTAANHKQEIQFWADIVLERPEIVPELDPRLTALVWGYEADHPLGAQAAHFSQAGLSFYLCPGTSTWNSLGTRLDNARENIETAGKAALEHGAEGLLLTDWGDYGHHQAPLLSLPPLLLAAQAGWNPKSTVADLSTALKHFALPREAEALASPLLSLGSLGRMFAFNPPNRMPLASVVTVRQDSVGELSEKLDTDELEHALQVLSDLKQVVNALTLDSERCLQLKEELSLSIEFLYCAAERISGQRKGDFSLLSRLRQTYTVLIGRQEAAWIRTHRVGGLAESVQWLREARDSLPSSPPRRPAWPPTARGG